MRKATREWVKKAEDDHHTAIFVAGAVPPRPDQVCYHCQQAAEKYLKALLEELGHLVPKTHDLVHLTSLLLPQHPGLKSVGRGLPVLNRYGVSIRYPGDNTTKRQAASALRWAARVRAACRAILGLREPRPGKSS
jgi:HEPN domain-containing protein